MLGLVVLGLAIARYVWTAKSTAEAVSVVAGLAAVLVATVPVVRWLLKRLAPTDPASEDSLNLAADHLASPFRSPGHSGPAGGSRIAPSGWAVWSAPEQVGQSSWRLDTQDLPGELCRGKRARGPAAGS